MGKGGVELIIKFISIFIFTMLSSSHLHIDPGQKPLCRAGGDGVTLNLNLMPSLEPSHSPPFDSHIHFIRSSMNSSNRTPNLKKTKLSIHKLNGQEGESNLTVRVVMSCYGCFSQCYGTKLISYGELKLVSQLVLKGNWLTVMVVSEEVS